MVNNPRSLLQFSKALGRWADDDPTAAISWYDQQLANGAFDTKSLDGRSLIMSVFLGKLIPALLMADPAGARQRVAALPAIHQQRTLSRSDSNLPEGAFAPFAKFVRDLLPPGQHGSVLAKPAEFIVSSGNLKDVTAYLVRIDASPVEREAAALAAGGGEVDKIIRSRPILRTDIEAIRHWAVSEAPETADRVAGTALAHATLSELNRMDFTTATGIALEYHEHGGNDEILGWFLEKLIGSRQDPATMHALAGKLENEERRGRILSAWK